MEKKAVVEEEDATNLQLGADFQDALCLLNSEVAILLEHRRQNTTDEEGDLSTVFSKTLAYVQRFSRYKTQASVKEVRSNCDGVVTSARRQLTQHELEEFEIAALSNLCPPDVEEAKALVPTLARKLEDDADLESLLGDLAAYRTFE